MDIITDLNEIARDDFMNKYKETLQNRIIELQTMAQNKDKKVVEMTEKYMNEKNLRKSAEAVAEDANIKLEELQNALSSFQEKTCALENEIEAYRAETQQQDVESFQGCLGDGVLDEMDDPSDSQVEVKESDDLTLADSLSLAVLREKIAKEQQHSFILEDRVAELEESLHEMDECKENVEEEAVKQQEWLKALLCKEREFNEKLSNESDYTIEGLQTKLREACEVNSQLMKWKDDVCNSTNLYEETEQKYKQIIAEYEIELDEAKSGLADIRHELLVLRDEQKRKEHEVGSEVLPQDLLNRSMCTSTSTQEEQENLPIDMHFSPESDPTSLDVMDFSRPASDPTSVSNVIDFSPECDPSDDVPARDQTEVIDYGNQKYRIMLAELIWNGMSKLLNLK